MSEIKDIKPNRNCRTCIHLIEEDNPNYHTPSYGVHYFCKQNQHTDEDYCTVYECIDGFWWDDVNCKYYKKGDK